MYKRALVPLDGSPVAESIIPFVLEIAGPLDMSVMLVRVLEPIPPIIGDGTQPVVVDDVQARTREAEEYLAPLAAILRARGVAVSWAIRRGRADKEILAAAQHVPGLIDALVGAERHRGAEGEGRILAEVVI